MFQNSIANFSINDLKTIVLFFISRLYGLISISLRPFIKVQDNSILFWSWSSRQYGCNPKAISDYIASHNREFKLYWSFKGRHSFPVDDRIIPLRWGSFKYIITALKCKFLISNTRNDIDTMLFYKRKEQIYIMTWHAGMGLKMAERDIENSLSKKYIKRCLKDSQMCDLMISGSNFQTNLFKNSFWYDGEILNNGTPRNDIFFSDSKSIKTKVCDTLHINDSTFIVLYAPTYRSKFNPDIISFNWQTIKQAVKKKFKKDAVLFVRLHPNVRNMVDRLNFKFNNKDCIDVTSYADMQELLIASNILITDYSSSMFDFSLMTKPCFLLVKDRNKFDRDFYIRLDALPFELAENDDELKLQILKFDEVSYQKKIKDFNQIKIKSFDNGRACEAVYNWMCKKQHT